jgi:methyl-accepting chemotaxis protein
LGAVARDTAAASAEVSASAQSLAQGTSQQAASLQQTAASSEQISSMTVRNAENSRTASEKMAMAARQIAETNNRLQQMLESMNAISGSGAKVSKIIRTIDEIAFQTNILALNAAVEAARAGNAGLGFAVVADEVRNLAMRCAEAARSTTDLIEESVSKTKEGKTRLDQMEESIRYLTATATEAGTLMDEIRAGSEEQARGITEVSSALTQMEKVTEANAAAAEQGAAAGEELASQSRTIAVTVQHLAALVDTGAAMTTERPKKPASPAPSQHLAARVDAGVVKKSERPKKPASPAPSLPRVRNTGPVLKELPSRAQQKPVTKADSFTGSKPRGRGSKGRKFNH